MQLLNESKELTFYQVDLTSIDTSCYKYLFQDGNKSCREMDRHITRFKMRDIKFYNCELITRVYDNET